MANLTPREKLAVARLKLRKSAPYFTAGITGLIPKEVKGLGTVGVTERGVLVYDPDTIVAWTDDQLAGALIHELFHVLRHHSDRCKNQHADHALWNKAADCEINDDILAAGHKLPDLFGSPPKKGEICTPTRFGLKDGNLAEYYYNELRKQQTEQQQQGGGDKGEGSGEEGKGEEGKDGPQVAGGWCGSGAGREIPGEPTGEGKGEGRTPAEIGRMIRQVAEAIQQEGGKGRGTIPGGWQRWAEEQLQPPKIRWQDKLSRACRHAINYVAGAMDYKYGRLSRRQGGIGFGAGKPILPILRAPVPKVAVLLDTSGSMSNAAITRALSETRGILAATRSEIDFIACDTDIHAQKKVRSFKELAACVKGGGGTTLTPALEAAAKLRPDLVVFCTDGGCETISTIPHGIGKLIWLVVGENRSTSALQCGEIVEIDD